MSPPEDSLLGAISCKYLILLAGTVLAHVAADARHTAVCEFSGRVRMHGKEFFGSRLPLLLSLGVGTSLVVAAPLHAENTLPIVTTRAAASGVASRDSSQPQRARQAREQGHDGAGYFDRGIRVSHRLGDEGHDGSGRFDYAPQPNRHSRLEQDGEESVALQLQ